MRAEACCRKHVKADRAKAKAYKVSGKVAQALRKTAEHILKEECWVYLCDELIQRVSRRTKKMSVKDKASWKRVRTDWTEGPSVVSAARADAFSAFGAIFQRDGSDLSA